MYILFFFSSNLSHTRTATTNINTYAIIRKNSCLIKVIFFCIINYFTGNFVVVCANSATTATTKKRRATQNLWCVRIRNGFKIISIDMLPLTHKDKRSFSHRIKNKLYEWKRLIFADKNSRNLFLFLLLNLSFAFVELFYGIATNSLGKCNSVILHHAQR